MSIEFKDSTALITGATGGIGQAIARALHAPRSDGDRDRAARRVLEDLRAELGERVETVVADLTDRAAVQRLAERNGVDVLVANAALPASGKLRGFTPDQMDRALDVNLRAPMQLAHGLLPGMLERGRGHIVLISSLAGKVATPGGSIYSATKFGLRGFGYALRWRAARHRSRSDDRLPRLHPRRRHVRRERRRSSREASARAPRSRSPRPSSRASRRGAPR